MKAIRGVFKMLTDLTVMVIFLVFWAIVCVLFYIVYSLDQDHEKALKAHDKALKD